MPVHIGGSKICTRCSVKNCKSVRYRGSCTKSIRFFRFPKPDNIERVIQWKLACNDESIMKKEAMMLYANNRICSIHFEADLVTNHFLSKNAVPTLNLIQKPRRIDVQTQTENFEENVGTERKQVVHANTQTHEELSQQTHEELSQQTYEGLSQQTPRKNELIHLIEVKYIFS